MKQWFKDFQVLDCSELINIITAALEEENAYEQDYHASFWARS